MFTQECFIRKNTPELVDKLSLLGGRSGAVFFDEKYNTLAVEEIFFRCVADNTADTLIKQGFIDCGTNEELFLAIAALRDDSDIHQWFIHDDSDWNDEPNIFWYKCESESINDDMALNLMCNDCRKATVEELIKYFKP